MTNLVERIRAAAQQTAEQADFIKIRKDLIADYTESLLAKYPLITEMDDNHFPSVSYVMALDTINFGSGYFRQELTYAKVARALKTAFEQNKMNTADKWAAADINDLRDLFSTTPGLHDELLNHFVRHLNMTGTIISRTYNGKVENMLEEAKGSAVRLAEIVGSWPHFHDVAKHKDHDVPIMKRAQIFAADIHLTLKGQGLGNFKDMSKLTIFADNMVPHVLRCDGILEYDPALASRIDAGEFIEPGSQEEVEIRAIGIHTVELMRQSVKNRVTSVNLDHILWHRGHEPEIYSKPSHKTKTVWY